MSNPASAVQQQIERGEFDQAIVRCQAALGETPEDPDLLYMAAVCHRYLGAWDEALACLQRLKRLAPEHGRAYQEEAHTYRDRGESDRAITSYALACRYNPALLASWRELRRLYQSSGRANEAAHTATQLQYLESLPKPLIGVMDLIAQGKLLKAEDLCRRFLTRIPHHVEAMRLLANIGRQLGVLDDAELLLESAVAFEPDNVMARVDYVQVLRRRQKFPEALEQAKTLLDRSPDNAQFMSLFAVECMQSGDYDTAVAMFDRVLARLPDDPATLTARGYALKTHGSYDAAVESFRRVCETHPAHGEAHYALGNLKVYRFSEDEIDVMVRQEQQIDLSHRDRIYLCFALGKAFEDEGQYDRAFHYYERGNSLKKQQSRYDADQMSDALAEQRRVCTRALMTSRDQVGCLAPDPIFIVGLPRAGSTLIEQILASHSQVDGTMELPNILSLAHGLRRETAGYPACLDSLSDDALRQMGERYLEDTRAHRSGAPYFIDKMPNNFRHIGLIRLILPNARIIDARRAPMACCFSGFKQLFAEGQEFTYSLDDIGRYYRDYVELMDHWDRVLPGHVLRVQHEDVVEDLEGQVMRLLEFCGLPFESSCVRYYETDRDVRTPSSEQVRQPIFKTALDQWQHFKPHLGPLSNALGELQ